MAVAPQVAGVIEARELAELCARGEAEVIDVRTPVEFREVHATCARNVPLETLDPQQVMETRRGAADATLYVLCRTGNRSSKACEAFIKAGYPNVVTVAGGTEAWDAAGLPVKRGRKAVSLERQVRIAAGGIVLTGALLGYFVHPAWIALSGFVGAGLVFAGVTDTCGMGMLLARMPWNQVRSDCSPADAGATCSG